MEPKSGKWMMAGGWRVERRLIGFVGKRLERERMRAKPDQTFYLRKIITMAVNAWEAIG